MPSASAPPTTFSSQTLVVRTEPTGARWRRLYSSRFQDPLGVGLAKSRFSDPTGKAFGVMYLGSSTRVAFTEVVLRDRGDGRTGSIPIPYAEIADYICAEIEIAADLRLVDLTGDSGLKMGVPSDVVGARDQTLARKWSLAFHRHGDDVDGVYYPSRLNEERNIALYDRSRSKLVARATLLLVEERDALAAIIDELDIDIV